MTLAVLPWIAFVLCSFIAVAGALGMTTTMSMFRSGIFLMASFIGVAGLFILLAADLMGLLQIMMYIGGMLVMILFMVLFMHDPGGAMMAAMPDMMSPVERLFSLGLEQRGESHSDESKGEHAGHEGMHDMEGMEDMDMAMTTPARPVAVWIAALTGTTLLALLALRPDAWPISTARPDPDSARAVGLLLMDKYMIAFEGAGTLILVGIFGAVFLARASHPRVAADRSERVATAEPPAAIDAEPLLPTHGPAASGEPGHEPSESKPAHEDHP